MSEPWFKTAFGPQYPLLYSHRNHAEAIKCLQVFMHLAPFKSEGNHRGRILDLGCGDGRHLTEIPHQFHDVFGLDLSWPLLELAAPKVSIHPYIHLVRGDMGQLPLMNQSFSAVLSLFTAFGYFGPLPDNASVIREISRILTPGGHWYFDYFDCDRVAAELGDRKPKIRNKETGPLEIREERQLNHEGNQVIKKVTMMAQAGKEKEALAWGIAPEGLAYSEEVAVFSKEAINELAARFNLFPIASAGNYDGTPLGQGDRWLMVFRKDVKEEGTV